MSASRFAAAAGQPTSSYACTGVSSDIERNPTDIERGATVHARRRRVPSDALQPVRTPRVYTEVVKQVLQLLESGQIAAGDVLPPERELAQQLGVSRSSVREAMAALEVLGVVRTRPGAGIFIDHSFQQPLIEQVLAMTSQQGPLEILETRL